MISNFKFQISNSESGVSLIITFFIMIILSAIVLAISVLLYSEVRIMKNMGDSVVSFYAADSGIEKVLFYDRQVVPEGADRGLCSIFDSCAPDDQNGVDHSIYCDNPVKDPLSGNGCDPEVCNNCQVKFATNFSGRSYFVTAKVYPVQGGVNFEIQSLGTYGKTQRQVEILTVPQHE